MDRDLPAHRVADDVRRFAEVGRDPSREECGDLCEMQRQAAPLQKKAVAAEPDEVDRADAMIPRQRFEVMQPPIGRTAEAMDEDQRRPGASLPDPERERR
jgi:hypothetical protein